MDMSCAGCALEHGRSMVREQVGSMLVIHSRRIRRRESIMRMKISEKELRSIWKSILIITRDGQAMNHQGNKLLSI